MTTMFAKHKVTDYAKWKKVYDEAASVQKEGGVTAQAVYRSLDDPNEVTVTHEFADLGKAKAFAENPALREAMQKAGVVGKPAFWFAAKD